MIPQITGVDHLHVYVKNCTEAEHWYKNVLGFKVVESLRRYAADNGPLTLQDSAGTVQLALFESDKKPDSVIAFGADGEQFLAWKLHLQAQSIEARLADHGYSWSLYFNDPYGNLHEITTHDHKLVAGRLRPHVKINSHLARAYSVVPLGKS
jgi:catechol 2,3-dioxygenase